MLEIENSLNGSEGTTSYTKYGTLIGVIVTYMIIGRLNQITNKQ